MVNSSRAILYASDGDDFAAGARAEARAGAARETIAYAAERIMEAQEREAKEVTAVVHEVLACGACDIYQGIERERERR